MALYTGVTGSISIDGEKIAHMSEWSLDQNKAMIDVPSFGQDYVERIPSLKDWSATCDGHVDYATDSGQKELREAFETGAAVEVKFYLDEDTFMSGTAFIESLNTSLASDGAATISISLAGSGATTLTLPTP